MAGKVSPSAVPECKKVIAARKTTTLSELPLPSKVKKMKKKKLNRGADEKENNAASPATKPASSMYVPKFCLTSSSPPSNTK